MSDRAKRDEEHAWRLGREYAEAHRLTDVLARDPRSSEEMYRDAVSLGCPSQWFDVFKYGAQSVWRERGELAERGRHRR